MALAYSYVRFSSPDQAKGHSLVRQIEAAEKYAIEHGLQLDTTLKADKGVSAFDGSNIAKGNLGLFLDNVKSGKIIPGSVLIIESLDRLSRADLLSALDLFTSIIRGGIKIVTLADGRDYDENSIRNNPFNLFASLLIMQRANEESAMKSNRIAAAWAQKRKSASKVKMTAICPDWLTLNREKDVFEIIPGRGELVRRIFEMARNGHGQGYIGNTLNRENIDPWGRGKKKGVGWHSSTIHKILTNTATIGHYEPHTKSKGEGRKSTGQVIDDYYPAVIKQELFYEVKRIRELRRPEMDAAAKRKSTVKNGSRKGKLSTLFTGLAKCGYCGRSMRYQVKGSDPRKGGRYLVCSGAVMGQGCRYLSVPYENFEDVFFSALRDLNLERLVRESSDDVRIAKLAQELIAGEEVLKTIPTKIERLTEAIALGDLDTPLPTLVEKIKMLENEKMSLAQRAETLRDNLVEQQSASTRATSFQVLLKELKEQLDDLEGDDLFDFRTRLGIQMRDVVEEVKIYPRNADVHRYQLEKIQKRTGKTPPEIQLTKFALGGALEKWPKYIARRPLVFLIVLRNGVERLVIKTDGNLSFIADVSKSRVKNPMLQLPPSESHS